MSTPFYTLDPLPADSFCGLVSETTTEIMRDLNAYPVADVVSNCKTAADLAAVAAEDVPKFLPQIYNNNVVVATELGKVGHNLATLSRNVDKVKSVAEFAKGRATLALLVGGGAAMAAYYLWKKHKTMDARVTDLEAWKKHKAM